MQFESLTERVRSRYKDTWFEDEFLEFKSARGGIPAELWSSYSAFANTMGGIILLGVEDDGSISGVNDPRKVIDTLFVAQNNPQKCSAALCDNRHIQSVTVAGKKVVAMYVPKAEPGVRPVYLRGNETNSYIRRGSADVRCKQEDITRMHRNRDVVESPVFSLDATILSHSCLRDLDAATLRKFRMRMQITSLGASLQDLEDTALLTKLGGYRVDRESGEEGITMAGLLMFGTSDALQEFLPHFQLDFFEYDGSTDIQKRWVDRITTDGTWAGNLYEFFFRVLPRLNQALKLPFKLNADLVREESTPAQIAVRETLANALIHADYFEHFGVRIDQRPTGITFTNPGSLLVDGEQLFSDQQHPSICRNKGLQKMFQALGVVDKAGSGIDKIVNGWMDYCIALPQLQELQQPDRVVWSLPYTGMIPRERIAEVSDAIGQQAFADLDRIDKFILLCVPSQPVVGNSDLAGVLRVHPADLSKRLARLVKCGLLQSAGRGRGTKYGLPMVKSSTSEPKSSTSEPKSSTSERENANLPESAQLVRRQKKTTREEMRAAILELCTGRWLSIRDIADTLERTMSTIRPHCEVLVAEKRLQPRYLDNSNHPQQAYSTVTRGSTP